MMNKTSMLCSSTGQNTALAAGTCRYSLIAALIAATAIAAAAVQSPAAPPPAEGDIYVYRVINAYNNEIRGQLSYRVDKTEAGRITMSVSADRPGMQTPTPEILTSDGKWLRHSIVNHDQLVDYAFSPAYPSYEFPLDTGKEWSTRVNAVNATTGVSHSVRIDATVVGTERIRVPAGEFDTIKIRRSVYAGDSASYLRLTETNIAETEWFAPALGRTVRIARNSGYLDLSRGPRSRAMRGEWEIHELVSAPPMR
jgi:hypothetical protein